jgi:WD40 repeat protein
VPLATTAASQGGTVVAQPKSNLPAILVVGFILIVGALRLTSPRQPPEPYFPHRPNGENLIISPPPPFSAPPTSGSTAVASNMSWMRPLAAEQRRLEQASIETGPYIVSPERRPIILQGQDINGAKFSRDAKLLAIISTNKQDSTNAKASAATPEATSKVHLWDVEKRQFRRSFDLNRKLSYTSTPYAFSDDLHWFGVNGQDTTTLWNLRTGKLERTWKRKPATLSGTAAQGGTSFYPSPGQLLFLRDGRMATIRREIRQSYSSNPTITYWITFYDIKSGHQSQSQLSHPNLSGFPEMFSGYTPHWETISPDGKDLLTFLEAGKVTRLSIAEKGKLSSSPVQIPPQNRGMHTPLKDPFYPFLPHAIQYSPSGRFLTTLALNGTVNLYSAGREVSRLLPSYNLAFASDRMTISFSPDEELLALSRPDGMIGKGICLWSTDDSKFIQFLPLMVDPIAFVVDNDRVISIDDTGQICTWQRKSADLLQQAPKSLMTSYNAWKKAHAAPKADALLAFYSPQTRFDGMFKEYDYNKFRQLLMASQTDNWSRVTDTRSPMITKSDQGWVMHCSLDYKDGWGLKHARSGRRLVWAQSGGAWRIIEDEVGPYDTTTPTRVATSQATER